MYIRSVEDILKEALSISPSLLLSGARQVGKSTLSISLNKNYKVFDNLTERASALNDPNRFSKKIIKRDNRYCLLCR